MERSSIQQNLLSIENIDGNNELEFVSDNVAAQSFSIEITLRPRVRKRAILQTRKPSGNRRGLCEKS